MQALGIQGKALARIKDSFAEKLAFVFCKHIRDLMLKQSLECINFFTKTSMFHRMCNVWSGNRVSITEEQRRFESIKPSWGFLTTRHM
jgi:hypothetical protein